MLGHVHGEQQTVILRRKSESLDMCTDATMILHSIIICNICDVCNFMRTLLLLELMSLAKNNSVFFTYRNGFGMNYRLTSVIIFGRMVFSEKGHQRGGGGCECLAGHSYIENRDGYRTALLVEGNAYCLKAKVFDRKVDSKLFCAM